MKSIRIKGDRQMTDKPGVSVPDQASRPDPNRSIETFSPVMVTDTVGAVFLGIISLVLIRIVMKLSAKNRELEKQLKDFGSMEN